MPTNREELAARGWDELDILFISGDAYVDHPAFGVPLLARLLESEGFRVGILAQPDWRNPESLRVMGRPRLFAAVSSGAMDSMVNRYTAAKKVRNDDAYTPGGKAAARPDRAVIAYTAAVKGAFRGLPVVIGGIEASLRRLAHYDFWSDRVRRSILVDAKADLLVYGMGELALTTIARRAASGEAPVTMTDIPGTASFAPGSVPDAVILPGFDRVCADPATYNEAFRLAAAEQRPQGRPLLQDQGGRQVLVQPPARPLSGAELDRLYQLPFSRRPHPGYREEIPAYQQIRFSITTHRGCYGGCAFCAITAHQGKTIQSRSIESIHAEVDQLAAHPDFRGTVTDLGGPTANMYGTACGAGAGGRDCRRESCLFPRRCPHLRAEGRSAVALLRKIRGISHVRHLFVASGVRYDLLETQADYFAELLDHHVGGLLKIAPESTVPQITAVMRKPGPEALLAFLEFYRQRSARNGKRQGVVPYLIAGHPGCRLEDMVEVALFLKRNGLRVEQVQEFTPTPGTLATCIYYSGVDPFTGQSLHVPRSPRERRLQKALLLWHRPEVRGDILEALKLCRRESVAGELLGAGGGKGGRKNRGRQR
nr:YgiQ family radical SAM protein [Desulfuromonas sp. DDH964]